MNAGHRICSASSGSARCTRRVFLLSFLLSLTTTALSGNRGELVGGAAEVCLKSQWLRKLIADRQSAVRLGRAYLAAHPRYRHCTTLISDIEQRLQRPVSSVLAMRDVEQITGALQRLVVADYTRDEVVSVAGWVLSKTEAQLYALTALNR